MKIYSAQHRAIVEAPIMEKPDPQLYLTVKDYEVAMLTYEKRLTSYPPIPVLREHQNLFKDGQEVKEGIDYKIEHQVCGQRDEWIESSYELYQVYVPKYRRIVAIPIKQQDILPHFPRQSESFGNYGKRMIEPPTPSIKQQVSEEPTGEYYTIDYWEKRATHFEAEFDAANKEVLYLQEKQSALKKWVIEQRNLAHVNCLEETKQAYNNVIAHLESATSQVSEEDEFRGSIAKGMRQLKMVGVSEEDLKTKLLELLTNHMDQFLPDEMRRFSDKGLCMSPWLFKEVANLFKSEEDKEPLPQQEANQDLIEFDSMVDKIESILYKNKTDEADEGSWIEGKDFHHVAVKIASAFQSQLFEALAKIKSQEAEIAELRKKLKSFKP